MPGTRRPRYWSSNSSAAGSTPKLTTPPDAWDRFVSKTHTAFPAGHTGSLKEPYEALNLYTCGKEGGPASNWASNQSLWCNEAFDEIVLEMSQVHPMILRR